MLISANQAVQNLLLSKVVAIPTETVYGLAGVAIDPTAIKEIYKIKNRPKDNPLITHVSSFSAIQKYLNPYPDYLEDLVSYFSPGPISYLVNLKPESLLRVSTCNLNSVIFRIPSHPIALEILTKINKPLAAPSANTSGKFSPTSADMVEQDLGDKVSGIVDGGRSLVGLESTILDCRNFDKIIVLRPGVVGKKELQKWFSQSKLWFGIEIIESKNSEEKTPGNKYRHYCPDTPLFWLTADLSQISSNEVILTDLATIKKFKKILPPEFHSQLKFINLGLDFKQISQNLYSKLSELDTLKAKKGYLYLPSLRSNNSSLAKALFNRLDKAVSGK